MVITIDKKDTPESIAKKLEQLRRLPEQVTHKKSISYLCGAMKWEEEAVVYQKRLRGEWE